MMPLFIQTHLAAANHGKDLRGRGKPWVALLCPRTPGGQGALGLLDLAHPDPQTVTFELCRSNYTTSTQVRECHDHHA